MAARPIGSATVSFGLVSVPVKLYAAGEPSANISFNWLHQKCGSRLKQQYVCAQDGEKVEKDEMVKGYEFAKNKYVVFTTEELKALEEKGDGSIEIAEFVPAGEVDRIWVEKSYYVGPDKGGDRAYRLLGAAMRETGMSALGRYAARGKQYLVLLRPMENGLVMEQLRYAHEVRSFSEVPIGDGQVKPEELKLAVQLVEQIKSDAFRPAAYQDDVRERVLELIQRKVEGEDITAAPAEEPKTQIIDLMEALKASLARAEPGAAAERKPARRVERRPAATKAAARR
ncbi:MAG: Ku protein [Gemmatimonadetes bacterium]|nr:Ku protein [Gemmatimonadota bacterium]